MKGSTFRIRSAKRFARSADGFAPRDLLPELRPFGTLFFHTSSKNVSAAVARSRNDSLLLAP